MQIKPFTTEYADEVLKMLLDIWEDEFGFYGLERPDIRDIPKYYQSDDMSNFWMAVEGSEVVGTIRF